MSERILIVDDDPAQRRILEAAITRMGHACDVAADGETALDLLARPEGGGYAAVILDLVMPGADGHAVLRDMRARAVTTPVIVQTAKGGIDTVVEAMRAGAFDFVVKPVSPERLERSLASAIKVGQRERGTTAARAARPGEISFRDLLADSPAMERVLRLAQKAAGSNIPVLLEGESGVGKELIARAIQASSDRRSKSFVTVNCGAIPEKLVESILFGHEKGAFTGATERHTGKFVEANGGTLFLDEIGDLPLDVQVKLLRAVQSGEIETVGARRVVKVDIRLISATNKDLIEEVKAGRFREDLFYRLHVFPIMVPALRRRREDIPRLAQHFVRRFCREQALGRTLRLGQDALDLLMAYDWPGNIRQLENAVYRAVVLAEGDELTADEFPQIAAQIAGYQVREAGSGPRVGVAAETEAAAPVQGRDGRLVHHPSYFAPEGGFVLQAERRPAAFAAVLERPARASVPPPPLVPDGAEAGWLKLVDGDGQVRELAALEEETIRFALEHYRGRISEVARRLGIGRSTLYRKLRDYGIDPEAPRQSSES